MQISVGAFLLNKRKTATTAKDMPALPINNASSKWTPKDKEEMFPYIIIPVPYSAQKHVNMCGDACVNMLYAASGKKPPNDLSKNMRGIMEGLDADQVKGNHSDLMRWRPSWVIRGGTMKDLTPMRLAYGLSQVGPMMVSGAFARFVGKRWGHWIVVHGITDEMVQIADPWHGENRNKSFDWLLKHVDGDELPFYLRR